MRSRNRPGRQEPHRLPSVLPSMLAACGLKRLPRPRAAPRRSRGARLRDGLRIAAAVGVAGLIALGCAVLWVPFPESALDHLPRGRRVLDHQGQVLRETLGPGDVRSTPVADDALGDWAVKALIAAEDKRFYSHPGVDVIALLRAVGQNLFAGQVISGASTLSTQVIRMMEPRPRTVLTKLIESFRALQLETLREKAAILGQYLNRAPFGGNRVGLEAAARSYFGKASGDLTLGEAALLAGLPQAPSRFRPDRRLGRALQRRAFVFDRMEALGFITATQRAEAEAQPVEPRPQASVSLAPHWCTELLQTRTEEVIRSTLDVRLQTAAESALAAAAPDLARRGVHGGAVVVLEVASGAVRALVGSPDPHDDEHQGQVNGALAARGAGSTLKPFLYALALDRGLITPDTVLADVPKTYAGYRPANSSRTFHGLVRAEEALVLSLNLPALGLADRVGTAPFLTLLRSLGLSTLASDPSRYGISLALGTAEVRLIDLVNAYACLSRGGVYRPFRVSEDEPLGNGEPILSPQACALVADMLGGEERSLELFGHRGDARLPRVAWKTGTSNGLRDAWTISWNPEYVVGIWLGNPDGSGSEALKGIESAAPIAGALWRDLYRQAPAPGFAPVQGLLAFDACAASGRPCGPHCPPSTLRGRAIAGVTDPAPCAVHRLLPHDRASGQTVPPGRLVGADVEWRVGEEWPAEVRTWLAGDVPSRSALVSDWRIVSPRSGAVYRLLDLPGATGRILSLRTQDEAPGRYWFVNGIRLEEPRWTMTPGTHVVSCADERGREQSVTIRVEDGG